MTAHQTKAIFRPRLAVCCGLLLWLNLAPTHANSLSMAQQLSDMGTPEAALKIIDQLQSADNINKKTWEHFERRRFQILHRWEMWQEIVQRGFNLPAELSPEIYEWLLQHTIGAMLALGDSAGARALLRDWLWGPEANQRNFRIWRREIINSYLAEGKLREAAVALEYYFNDYRDLLIGSELRQQAMLLALTKQYDKALMVIGQSPDLQDSDLYLLLGLRNHSLDPSIVLQRAREKAQNKQLNHSDKLRLLKIAFEAAAITSPDTFQDLFLELLASPIFKQADQLFEIDAANQWSHWFNQARKLGNNNQLLIGQDANWLELALRYQSNDQQHNARALFAFVAVHGLKKSKRDEAHRLLAENLDRVAGGDWILVNLYLNAPLVIKYHNLGEQTRFKIADKAFVLNLPQEAGRLLADLPVRKEYALLKVLQQARILLLGGLHNQGVGVIRKVLKQKRRLNQIELDRLMQVIFDLQNLNLHDAALEMFDIVLANGPTEKIRRETLFWIANSLSYQKRYSEAAWHYLQSARLLGNPDDLWGRSARYSAAEVLIKGGFLTDAIRLFSNLLTHAKDSSRRSVLLNRIQQLRLQLSQKK